VDNCNPQTHSELTQICSQKSAQISLLTVEYDVRGDEPERTEVFRLSAGSSKTIADWIEANFDHVSSVDRDRIAEFSGGNFRVARVLAETLKKGDTFAELTDAQLFERIFHQRNDPDQQLLKAAQVLSLVYSYEGEDTGPDSELVLLGEFAGLDPDLLYEASAELQKRQVVQSRGRWRAVLPHAIANRLAAIAIDKTPPLKLENFLRKLPLRLIKSVSRRLGYLHESERAKALILGLLKSDGPWGDLLNLSDDGMQVLRNLAPVAPKAVLERIQEAVDGPHGDAILNPKQRVRWQIVELVRALAYEPKLFDQAACLLSRFVLAETPDENQNSAKDSFQGLFQLYLSGTMALPAQRRAIALALFVDVDTEQAGLLALRSLLNAGHFSSSASFDFGARPRTFGWEPKTYGEQWEWHVDALALAAQLCERPSVGNEIGSEVANQVRSFVTNDPCLTALEEFADTMLMQGPWIDGWREVRMAQRFDSDKWPQKVRDRVGVLEEKLRPSDRASEIQAWVLSGYGFYDLIEADADDTVASYERRGEQAQEKARQLGAGAGPDREALSVLLPDLLTAANSQQVFHFGRGLAQDCTDRSALWQVLLDEFEQLEPNNRKIELLGGFFAEAHKQNDPIYGLILDHCLAEESLQLHLVYFQGLVGYDNEGMQRIWTGVENGTVGAIQFSRFACGLVRNLPTADLPMILKRVAGLEGGASIALEIAHMAIHCAKSDKEPVSEELLQAGREILAHNEFRRGNDARQHAIKECLKFCYEDGQHANQLRELAVSVQRQMDGEPFRAWEYENILAAIFEASPEIGLEVFVAGGSTEGDPIFGFSSPMRRSPIEQVDPAKLWEWADQDAQDRFPTLGRALKPFPDRVAETVTAISQTYLDALERAPDASAFLSAAPGHLGPSGWMGNLSSILDQRRESFEELLDHPNEAVRLWAAKSAAHLGAWADSQREKEAEDEERFE